MWIAILFLLPVIAIFYVMYLMVKALIICTIAIFKWLI